MTSTAQQRLISLDVFRGMTIAGMVLVNNPGTWSAIYSPLEHAPWHGITPTDYIFPFFLFIVGVAIPIALGKRLEAGMTRDVYLKIFSRSVSIFAVGLLISMIPFFDFGKTEIPYLVKILLVLSFSAALFLYLWGKRTQAGIVAGVSALIVAAFWLAGTPIVWYNFQMMRIPGVLQRIAVCYLIVSLIFLHTNWKQQTVIGVALLLIYWALMTLVAVPGCEVTTIDDKACNLAAWLDRTILTENHMWRQAKVFDPEGILSTIPALVTTISGVLTGIWLKSEPRAVATGFLPPDETSDVTDAPGSDNSTVRSNDVEKNPAATAPGSDSSSPLHLRGSAGDSSLPATKNPVATAPGSDKAVGIFFFGTVLLAIGWSWSLIFPLNKSLWTSSYVVYTSGLALLTLGFCYWLIDVKGYKRWSKPFVVFGVNALALFAFSGLMARLMGMIRIAGADGKETTLQGWIFNNLFLSWASPINASLAYAICFILFWLILMWLLYRRRIFIKV